MTHYPAAVVRPGPAGKVWPGANAIDGIIEHSMQGSLAGGYSVLDDEAVNAQGSYIAASWHFSIAKDGTVYQHYPLDQSPFHAGTKAQNLRLIGVEHEGGGPGNLSEPLTEAQVVASVALAQWIAEQGSFTLARDAATRTLYEHGEVSATLCPSGRIPWARYLPPAPVPPPVVYPVPDVQWVAAGWGDVMGTPWEHVYPMKARTVRPGAYIGLERDGRDAEGWEQFRLVIQDYEGD